MTCAAMLGITSAWATDGQTTNGANINLEPEVMNSFNPVTLFPPSLLTDPPSAAGTTVPRVKAAGAAAVQKADELLEKIRSAKTDVAGRLAAEADPVTRAILRTQLATLVNAEQEVNKTRQGAMIVAAARSSQSGRSMFLDGRQTNPRWSVNAPSVTRLGNAIAEMEATVNAVTNRTTDESTGAQVGAAKATLAKGTAATGGVLTSPGAAAADEKIIITEGVTNRTLPGQHGDLLMHGIGSGEATLRETPDLGETKRTASLLMLGEHQEAKISAGESAILIGDNSKTEGNGIAIGKNTTSANDAIALGNYSVATMANELSIGNDDGLNRKITHMADGTNDSDGATIHNINEATEQLENRLTQSMNTSHDDAIGQAKTYTDDTTSDANAKVLREATTYTDDTAKETLKTANEQTERRAVIAENNAVTRSNTYTDERSSRTLEKANTYTNHQVAQAENNAVTRSNDYTNKRFGELKHQVDRNEKRANGGIAGAMAMTAIPSVPGHNFSFGMAASGYRDQGAVAAGVKANITQDTTVSLNTAWDSGNGVGVAAGFSVGW